VNGVGSVIAGADAAMRDSGPETPAAMTAWAQATANLRQDGGDGSPCVDVGSEVCEVWGGGMMRLREGREGGREGGWVGGREGGRKGGRKGGREYGVQGGNAGTLTGSLTL
jgi:hypothetical protein